MPEAQDAGIQMTGKETVGPSFNSQLLIDIFQQNQQIGGSDVTPLNAESIIPSLKKQAEREYQQQKDFFDEVVAAKKAIEEKGATEEVYAQHRRAINHMAREASEIGGYHFNVDNEDRLGQAPTEEQTLAYPTDGEYRDEGYTVRNIFKHSRTVSAEELQKAGLTGVPSDEGVLYQRIYDDKGELQSIRIYAQTHRNYLQVKTVSAADINNGINNFIGSGEPSIPEIAPDMMSKTSFMAKVAEFNSQNAGILAVQIDEDTDKIALQFKANILAVMDRLKSLSRQVGIVIDRTGGFTKRDDVASFGSGEFLGNLVIEPHDGSRISFYDFNPETHKNTDTVLHLNPGNVGKLAPLIKLYADSFQQ